MALPDAEGYNPDPKYLRKLVEQSGLSQRQCATRLGVNERTMRGWVLGERQFPYSAQYAMEQLAKT
jgi:transcriptional regulator with XRE-family HTH domain